MPEDRQYTARLRLLDGTLCPETGKVTFIDSKVQPGTGVIQARAVFENKDGVIMPGQYVRLIMGGDVLHDAILIPQKCVIQTQKGSSVMLVDKDNVVSVGAINIAATVGDQYLIDSGLESGQRIISEGMVKARPGSKVSIVGSKEELDMPQKDQKQTEPAEKGADSAQK